MACTGVLLLRMSRVCYGVIAIVLLAQSTLSALGYALLEPERRGLSQTSDLVRENVNGLDVLSNHDERFQAINKVLSKLFHEWNITLVNPSQGLSSGAIIAHLAGQHEVTAHLQHVLDIAEILLQGDRGCRAGAGSPGRSNKGRHAECPAPAPELLQGRTSAFLSSTLRTYPRGPTSRADLLAWATAANHFLDEHHRLQRLQRTAASQAADAAADAAAFYASNRAAESAKRVAERNATPVAAPATDDARGDGGGGGGPNIQGGADDEKEDYEDEQSSRRLVEARQLGSNQGGHGGEAGAGESLPPEIPANFTGVKYGGLPLVRRVLLAQLLLGWATALRDHAPADGGGGDGGVSELAEKELTKMMKLLYGIHVESVVQRAIMEYFHISKAGGTSWTAAAGLSGCERPRANAARERRFDDDCRWINGSLLRQHGVNVRRSGMMQVCSRFDVTQRQSAIRDCKGRLRYALSRGFQYISNEYTLHGGVHDMYDTHICPQFVNVISIREPLQRLASNIKYMVVRLSATLFRKPPASELFPKLFCNVSTDRWEVYSPPVADNYNIRTLVGERAFHTPLYGIGEAHEALAKQLLIQFDLILDLNAGDAAADSIMREGLGWTKTLAEVRVWTSDRLTSKAGLDLEESCQLSDLTPLLVRQVYDQRWYSFGRALSRLDQLFLGAAAHLGLQPWPDDWEGSSGGTPAGLQQQQQQDRSFLGTCGLFGASQALRRRTGGSAR